MTIYSKAEASEVTGLSERKIQFLIDQGVIDPRNRGRGTSVGFDDQNITGIMMSEVLRDRKVSNMTIKLAFWKLRQGMTERADWADFFTNKKWGRTEDLLYITAPTREVGLGNTYEAITAIGSDYSLHKDMGKLLAEAAGPITIIPLGKTMIEARGRLNR